MYLKTLEMQGFKSFPDKTVISFRPGVTAIVGANGSGKSNISDAVRWVLGEMSPKTLRGGKMEDVIFNGTAKRRPAGYAEVVMTIDNSDGLMKIDYDEASVARRLYRTGESEYYINKKQCRLKDVVDLFLNTGIGREGYSVIGQGKIAEIISQKGDERREVFEEAAGISRFRYRKNEAVNKLVRVNENAVRIGDIIAEVEARLPALESQSEKALKFLSLDGEKKQLELAICAARLRVIDGERASVAEKYEKSSSELRGLTDALTALDTRLDEMYVENQKNNVEAERLRNGIAEKNTRLASSAGRLSVLENDIRHYEEKISETVRELSEVEGQIKLIGSTGTEADERLAAEIKERDALRAEYEEKKTALNDLDQRIAADKSRLAGITAEIAALSEIKQKNERLESENEGFSRAREDRMTLLHAEQDRISAELAGKKAALESCREQAARAAAEKSGIEARLAEICSENANTELDIDQKREARETSRLKQLELEQRRETLLRMDRLLEGFSGSVKEVMNAADRGELHGIYGPISKLIKTEEKYITAIETTLGNGMQHIVCEDEKSAKAAIDFLKRSRSGRATFLPLTTIRPDPIKTDGITDSGFVGRADGLIECDEKFAAVVRYLLGRTAVAEDIDSADRIARSRGYNLKIVSLDGQIINAGGSFTGGQQLHKTGILSRNADIAALDASVNELKKKNETLKAELNLLSEKQAKQKNEIKRLTGELSDATDAVVRQNGAVEIEQKLLDAVQERFEAVSAELDGISTSKEEESRRIAELIREKEQAQARLEQSSAAGEQLTRAISEAGTTREELFTKAGDLSARLAVSEQRIAQLESEKADASAELCERERTAAERKESLNTLNAQIAAAKAEIASLSGEKDTLASEIEADKAALDGVRIKLDEYDRESYSLRDRQKQMTSDKERLIDSVGRLEGKLGAIDREKESFIVRLREEYELDENSPELTEIPDGRAAELGGRERLNVLKQEIRRLGPVNVDSIGELKETRERYDFLSGQYADIQNSRDGLEKLIATLEKTMRDMFVETFEKVRECFKETFTELFGGGSADIVLTESDDVLQSGIEINIQPPGKLVKSLSLLSGGEQAFVAIALYFALLKVNPSPFCIFDEIESALDEANVYRFGDYLKRNCDKTQFIVITHRRGTMESANMLYGIAMQEKGVSDYIKLVPGDIKFKDDTIVN